MAAAGLRSLAAAMKNTNTSRGCRGAGAAEIRGRSSGSPPSAHCRARPAVAFSATFFAAHRPFDLAYISQNGHVGIEIGQLPPFSVEQKLDGFSHTYSQIL